MDEEKTCPRCAEAVKAAAKVCRFCGHEFVEPPPPVSPRGRAVGIAISAGLIVATAALAYGASQMPASPRAERLDEPAAGAMTAEQQARKQDCETRWLQAEQAGIILGSRSAAGVPQVVVDEDTFANVDYSTKAGYADTLNCAAFGGGRTFARIEFYSHRTNNLLGLWTPGRGFVVN